MKVFLLTLLIVGTSSSPDLNIARDFVKPIQNAKVQDSGPSYEELHDEAMFNCPHATVSSENQKIIAMLVEIEKAYNPPPKMRGMLLAAACMESGFNPFAKGDHKFSKSKKKAMAIGILQQWPFYEKHYGTVRTDPKSAATSWMDHIVKQLPKVKKMCSRRSKSKLWLAAWVTGIRSKKVGGRCNEVPLHYRLLKRWHKNISKDRKVRMDCASQDTCGC